MHFHFHIEVTVCYLVLKNDDCWSDNNACVDKHFAICLESFQFYV